jgi:hypothetical protein
MDPYHYSAYYKVMTFNEVETRIDPSNNERIIEVLIEGETEVLKSVINGRLNYRWAL